MFVIPRPRRLSKSAFMFGFMGIPFADFGCVRTPLSAVGGARPLPTHRAQARCAVGGDFLPFTLVMRGQVHGNLGAGAVGGFYALHGRSVFNFGRFGCNNNSGAL